MLLHSCGDVNRLPMRRVFTKSRERVVYLWGRNAKQRTGLGHAQSLEPIFERALSNVREELIDNPYLAEAIARAGQLAVSQRYRSFWNAVVDDLRNKIIHPKAFICS